MYYSTSIFYLVFATTFVLVQCDHLRSKRHVEFTPYGDIDCTNKTKHNKILSEVIMNATCKPHYTHVALQPQPLVTFNPSIVYVPRCSGQCSADVVCEPIKTRTIDVPVIATELNQFGGIIKINRCAAVKVEIHDSCSCMCSEKETDCTAKEMYMKSRCKCECNDRPMQKQNCEVQMGMFWDDDDCSCKCMMKNMECTTGFTWNATICQCSPSTYT